LFWLFWRWDLKLVAWTGFLAAALLISASQVATITDMSHQLWLRSLFFIKRRIIKQYP
jgi:hypothetical protein